MAPLLLPGLFSQFATAYPDLHLDIGLTDRYVDLIREDYDVALRVGRPKERDLIIRRLAVLPTVLVASPAYIDRWGMPNSVEALRSMPFARYSMSGQLSSLVLGGISFTPPGRVTCDSGSALIHAARQGLGAALLLRCLVAEELRTGALLQLAPEVPLPDGEFSALHAFGRFVPPRIRLFLDYIANEAESLADL